jgi:hypothetical protein
MTDTANTLDQLNIVFQNLIIGMLGYEATGSPEAYSPEAYSKVRISWPSGGAPAWNSTEDKIFIRVTEDDDKINRQKDDRVWQEGSPIQLNLEHSYIRVIRLSLVLYGPNSWENVQLIRDQMFYSTTHRLLYEAGLRLLTEIPSPIRGPELFQGNWWEREDIGFLFNERILRNEEVGIIESAEITVYNEVGTVVPADVPPEEEE